MPCPPWKDKERFSDGMCHFCETIFEDGDRVWFLEDGSILMPAIYFYYDLCESCAVRHVDNMRSPTYMASCFSLIWGQESPEEAVHWVTQAPNQEVMMDTTSSENCENGVKRNYMIV